jgi:hypothetical protein
MIGTSMRGGPLAPTRVRRPLTDDEVAALHTNAAGYEQATRTHAASPEPV